MVLEIIGGGAFLPPSRQWSDPKSSGTIGLNASVTSPKKRRRILSRSLIWKDSSLRLQLSWLYYINILFKIKVSSMFHGLENSGKLVVIHSFFYKRHGFDLSVGFLNIGPKRTLTRKDFHLVQKSALLSQMIIWITVSLIFFRYQVA